MTVRTVYTGASWRSEAGIGGWAWVVYDGMWAAGQAAGTTTNRLQLQAAREALLLGRGGQLAVATAADYVVNCFDQKWWVALSRVRISETDHGLVLT